MIPPKEFQAQTLHDTAFNKIIKDNICSVSKQDFYPQTFPCVRITLHVTYLVYTLNLMVSQG